MNSTDLGRTANTAVTQSKSFLNRQVDARTTDIGNRVSSTASDLRRIANDLEQSQTVSGAADLANYGADFVDRIGNYLREADGERLVSDLEDFARQRPWTVAASALVAGLALSRLLKASSSRRYETTYGGAYGTGASEYADRGYGQTTYGTGQTTSGYGSTASSAATYGSGQTTGSYAGESERSPSAKQYGAGSSSVSGDEAPYGTGQTQYRGAGQTQ